MVLLSICAVCFVFLLYLELTSHSRHRIFEKGDKESIKKYMHDWILNGGRVAIWTRDMSWADSADTHRLLKEKAALNELILCLHETNELTEELSRAGAEICAYGKNTLELPASRFTISCFGRDGARVAVGRAEGENHVIDEFNSRTNPAYFLAEDLVKLVRAKCDRGAV
jgi:hypothetical protein